MFNGDDELSPARGLDAECAASGRRESIVFRAAIVVGELPVAVNPFFLFQSLERGIERSLIDLEHAVGGLLDALCDSPAVHGTEREGAEEKEVDRAA